MGTRKNPWMGTLSGIAHPLFLPALRETVTSPATLQGAGTGEPREVLRAEETIHQSGVPLPKPARSDEAPQKQSPRHACFWELMALSLFGTDLAEKQLESFSASAPPPGYFDRLPWTRRGFTVAHGAPTGDPTPHNHRESGECRKMKHLIGWLYGPVKVT
jgi:hypothetical protein